MTHDFPARWIAVVGLGGNLGDREATLRSAVLALRRLALLQASCRVSALYETAPLGPPQPVYLNAAVRLEVGQGPEALLDALLGIEVAHGRVRREKWGPRTLDLDLLWAGTATTGGVEPLRFRSARLEVPHPHLEERAFALAPLCDVLPELASSYSPVLAGLGGPPPWVAQGSGSPAEWPWALPGAR